jgi:hypothetical protein
MNLCLKADIEALLADGLLILWPFNQGLVHLAGCADKFGHVDISFITKPTIN